MKLEEIENIWETFDKHETPIESQMVGYYGARCRNDISILISKLHRLEDAIEKHKRCSGKPFPNDEELYKSLEDS